MRFFQFVKSFSSCKQVLLFRVVVSFISSVLWSFTLSGYLGPFEHFLLHFEPFEVGALTPARWVEVRGSVQEMFSLEVWVEQEHECSCC